MLSYRHAFHAGNHADVLKHAILLELLDYYGRKDKPWWFIDTHAGAGCYALEGGQATKTAEFVGGIGRLWTRNDPPAPITAYLAAVRQFNPHGGLLFYPGSPALAMTRARTQDRLRLYVDGRHVAESSAFDASAFALDADASLRIGAGPGDYFHGRLADLRLYNRALEPDEIGRLARAAGAE